jgi:hypothetical protein
LGYAAHVTGPNWRAAAFDSEGRELDAVSEGGQFGTPSQRFTLRVPGITSVRLEKANFTGTSFGGPPIVDLTLVAANSCPLTILPGASVSGIDAFGANVSWSTNLPSSSDVEYGTTVAYTDRSSGAGTVTNHNVSLIGLTPNTAYHYRVISEGSICGNTAMSEDATFVTNFGRPRLEIRFESLTNEQNQYVLFARIMNRGTGIQSARNVTLTRASLGSRGPDDPTLPEGFGSIGSGNSVLVQLVFPLSAGPSGNVVGLIVAGTYTDEVVSGQTLYFGRSFRVTLP